MTDILVPVANLQQATAALNAIAAQVRTDHKAMSEWATTQADFVTVKDEAGLAVQVPSLDKLNRDFSGLETDVRSLIPQMYGRPVSEYYAARDRARALGEASGFLSLGRHYPGTSSGGFHVNQGLWGQSALSALANTLVLGFETAGGDSDTLEAVAKVAGQAVHLHGLGVNNYRAYVRFSPAPDGKTTYNKATGEVVTHSSVDAAFDAAAIDADVEVVTERVDLYGLEVWLEKVTDAHPYIYPNGIVGCALTSMDGYPTEDDNRPESYHAQYPGDVGMPRRGVNSKTIPAAQLAVHLQNPKNGLVVLEDGTLAQRRARLVTVAGPGNGDWVRIDSFSGALQFGHDSTRVGIQGAQDVSNGLTGSGITNHFYGANRLANPAKGVFATYNGAELSDAVAVDGECYFLVLGTHQRLNQGAYHPSFNRLGTRGFRNSSNNGTVGWHSSLLSVKPTSARDCFFDSVANQANKPDIYGSGFIASGKGSYHPLGRFFDAVYPGGFGGITDRRLEVRQQTQADHDRVNVMVKAGTYRGLERLPYCGLRCTLPEINGSGSSQYVQSGRVNWILPNGDVQAFYHSPNNVKSLDGLNVFFVRESDSALYRFVAWGNMYHTKLLRWNGSNWVAITDGEVTPDQVFRGYPYATDVGVADNGDLMFTQYTGPAWDMHFTGKVIAPHHSVSVSGEVTWCTGIGHPLDLAACADLAEGWLGNFSPDMPDGMTRHRLGRVVLGATEYYTYTADRGVTWNSASNSSTIDAASERNPVASGTVLISSYTVWATMTEPCANALVRDGEAGLGNVFVSADRRASFGALLMESLSGKVPTSLAYTTDASLPLTKTGLYASTGLLAPASEPAQSPTHPSVDSLSPRLSGSLACKSLRYAVEDTGLANNVYAFAELGYSGDWGDSGVMPIVSDDGFWVDDNGVTRKAGSHKLALPFGWV